jgi:hypothetical protein
LTTVRFKGLAPPWRSPSKGAQLPQLPTLNFIPGLEKKVHLLNFAFSS